MTDLTDTARPKVLLVDDQPANLLALEAALEPLGLSLVTAQSGMAALKQLLSHDFAVILLDVHMPGMDGCETARLIKARERSRHIPLIFVTAMGDDNEVINEAYRSGAVDYLAKPINPVILKAKVLVFVNLYRQREAIRQQAEQIRLSAEREAELKQAVRNHEAFQEHARQVEVLFQKQRRLLREVLSSASEGRLQLCDTEDDLPTPLPPHSEPLLLTREKLRFLRRQVTEFAKQAGWPISQIQDFEIAVGEAAMNAVVHGKNAVGRLHADKATGALQVWIQDTGTGIPEDVIHRAILEKGYTTAGTLGHGFWMILRTVNRVALLTGPTGTTVVLEHNPHI